LPSEELPITQGREQLAVRLQSLDQLLEEAIPFKQVHLRPETEPLPSQLWRKMEEAGWLDIEMFHLVNLAAVSVAMGQQGLPAHCGEHLLASYVLGAPSQDDRLCLAIAPTISTGRLLVRFAAWSQRAVIVEKGQALVFPTRSCSPLRTTAGEGWQWVGVRRDFKTSQPAADLVAEGLLQLSRGAEVYGILQRLYTLTRDYVRQREQFGRPIGSFQAVQHTIANMLIGLVALESLLVGAIVDGDHQVMCAARLGADSVGDKIASDAVQLHGALGFSSEHPVALLYRRVQMLRLSHEQREKLLSFM
jgi:hypothetical protein